MSRFGVAGARYGRWLVTAAMLAGVAGCQVNDMDHAQSHKDFEALTNRNPGAATPPPAQEAAPPPIP